MEDQEGGKAETHYKGIVKKNLGWEVEKKKRNESGELETAVNARSEYSLKMLIFCLSVGFTA